MTDEPADNDDENTAIDGSTAERIRRVEEIIRAVEKGEMTVGEGKEALAEVRELIEEMQSEFDEGESVDTGNGGDDGDGQSQND